MIRLQTISWPEDVRGRAKRTRVDPASTFIYHRFVTFAPERERGTFQVGAPRHRRMPGLQHLGFALGEQGIWGKHSLYWRGQATVRNDDWRLIVHRSEGEIEGFELFDFREDPHGRRSNPEHHPTVVDELLEKLEADVVALDAAA